MSATGTAGSEHVQRPAEFLTSLLGKAVEVKLNAGITYRGVIVCLDGFMNVVLQNAQEWVEGVQTKTFGDVLIRGNNVMFIGASA